LAKGQIKQKQAIVDWELFEKLCHIHNTRDDIAYILGLSKDSLHRAIKNKFGPDESFDTLYKKHSANGRTSLRKAQFKAALEGNTTMLVWLGKQYLGQVDRQDFVFERIEPLVISTSREQITLELKEAESVETNVEQNTK
jgi:hypothetical protein